MAGPKSPKTEMAHMHANPRMEHLRVLQREVLAVLHGIAEVSTETPIINSSVVKEEIQNLKRFGSPGPDKIRNIVLLEAADELSQPLAKIFNLSLESSVVPYDWRSANVTPVHKGGSKKMVSNYRPISLTSTVSKIMESII